MASAEAERQRQLIVFELDGSSYALGVEQVAEVVRMVDVAPLPQTPSWLCGVINLRGRVIPVVDLRAHIGVRAGPVSLQTPIIVVRDGDHQAGLIADAVHSMISVREGQMEINVQEHRPLAGVVRQAEHIILLLNLPPLLQEAAALVERS